LNSSSLYYYTTHQISKIPRPYQVRMTHLRQASRGKIHCIHTYNEC